MSMRVGSAIFGCCEETTLSEFRLPVQHAAMKEGELASARKILVPMMYQNPSGASLMFSRPPSIFSASSSVMVTSWILRVSPVLMIWSMSTNGHAISEMHLCG